MRRFIAVVCLPLAFVFAATPPPAQAGVSNIWPDQFDLSMVVGESQLEAYGAAVRTKRFLSVKSGMQVAYEAEVKLPVGATITEVAISAGVGSSGGRVVATFSRSRLGVDSTPVSSSFDLDGVTAYGWYSTHNILAPKVYAGHKYWLWVVVSGQSGFLGARVTYR